MRLPSALCACNATLALLAAVALYVHEWFVAWPSFEQPIGRPADDALAKFVLRTLADRVPDRVDAVCLASQTPENEVAS